MKKFTLNLDGCQFTGKWHQAGTVQSSDLRRTLDHWTLDVLDLPSNVTGELILPGNWAFGMVMQYIEKLHDGLFGRSEEFKQLHKESQLPLITPK